MAGSSFSEKPFYDSDLPATMRFAPVGGERSAPFNASTHLARLLRMADQITESAADEDGDAGDMVRAEIEATIAVHPELRDQLSA